LFEKSIDPVFGVGVMAVHAEVLSILSRSGFLVPGDLVFTYRTDKRFFHHFSMSLKQQ
jgi:hypothetical protein